MRAHRGAAPDGPATPIDCLFHAAIARATGGVSPVALWLACLDWAWHLAGSPGKQMALFQRIAQLAGLAGRPAPVVEPDDPRFAHPDWNRWPFDLLRDTFFQAEAFWQEATADLRGVSPHHERVVSFSARQWTDMLSPSNCWCLNPEVLRALAETGGCNFLAGACHWLDDYHTIVAGHVLSTSPGRCARIASVETSRSRPVRLSIAMP